ncbi:hypothetical protein T07_10962 [Trichinella nelsoni]|uniref:Uncharacterized protein n=1 Tax=Trichinella nelsoni TaxID=6336 RepID=A0A0V0RVB1_9BILA|nr:hypothetical protein T07_10962 [Trichinella nelsoni]
MGPAKTNKGNYQSPDLRLGKKISLPVVPHTHIPEVLDIVHNHATEDQGEDVTKILLAAAEVGCQTLVPCLRNVRQSEAASEQGSSYHADA